MARIIKRIKTTFSRDGMLRTRCRNLRIYVAKQLPSRAQLRQVLHKRAKVIILISVGGTLLVFYCASRWLTQRQVVPIYTCEDYLVIFERWGLKVTRSEMVFLAAGACIGIKLVDLYWEMVRRGALPGRQYRGIDLVGGKLVIPIL